MMRALPGARPPARRRPDRPVRVHGAGDQGPPRLSPGSTVRGSRRRDRDRRRIHRPAGRRAQMARRHSSGDRSQEEVEVTVPTGQAARITIQDLFLRYRYLAGMTGTALTSAREFRKIYRMPRRARADQPAGANASGCRPASSARAEQKWAAVVEEVKELHAAGRPVLIGTRSIDKSRGPVATADRVRDSALRAQCQRNCQGGGDRGAGRTAG